MRLVGAALACCLMVFAALVPAGCGGDDEPPKPAGSSIEKVVVADVKAADGARVELPDGAVLEIPPGALPRDERLTITSRANHERKILGFIIEPTGIALAKPARLTFTYDRPGPDEPLITVDESSVLNPIADLGSELSDWRPARVVARDNAARTVSVELDHFTFIFATVGVDREMYMVVDLPPRHLQPGDVLFYLTRFSGNPGADWSPGHVAMFVGNAGDPSKSAGRIIEANGERVAENELGRSKTEHGHIYLGPRRWKSFGARSLTFGEQQGVATFLESRLGSAYALIGDQGLRFDGTSGDTFSCVGLCEAALRSVGKGLLPVGARISVSTPLEYWYSTGPIDQISIACDEPVEIPVSGVLVDPRSPYVLTTFRGYYADRGVPYQISKVGFWPPNADLAPRPQGYLLTFTPDANDAGRQVQLVFEMYGEIVLTDPLGARVAVGPRRITRGLTIAVEPCGDDGSGVALDDPEVDPIDAVFTQQTFSTRYSATIRNPDGRAITTSWSGTDCGTVAPESPVTSSDAQQTASMVWTHPHPPCDATTQHADRTIVLDVSWDGGGRVCTYAGAESGRGPACTPK